MTKYHEGQALEDLASAPKRPPRMTVVSEPSYGRYQPMLFIPEGKAFWPTGFFANLQCGALALIILCEVLFLAKAILLR